jgi:methylenetetrahydrofolate dehydrogenase (NADP+)/methenyltetrahydrofolate cyclohydrolase
VEHHMIVDGRALAEVILARTKVRAEALPHRPKVAAYVGPSPTKATESYLKIKAKSAALAGCDFIETEDLSVLDTADAIIVQLPTNAEGATLLEHIPLGKDADVLSKSARDLFARAREGALLPPVVAAVREIFEAYNFDPKGKQAVVVGDGWLVGNPCAQWLTNCGASVITLTKDSPDRAQALSSADIIVSGVGVPGLITPDEIKEGVVLIDAGTSESNGEMRGDADPLCAGKCSLFTPVPGGVGPVAVACLFANAVTLAERRG